MKNQTIQQNSIKGDILISFAVFIQPALILLQTILIAVFHMDPDATTVYRVALTATPMIVAIFVAMYRKLIVFVIGYGVALLIMILHSLIFPANALFILEQGTRFFLPVVLPSLLCLLCVNNYEVMKHILYDVSWLSTLLVLIYVVAFLRRIVFFSNYNMSFSFACLLPMVSLYMNRKPLDMVAVVIMFLSVLAIGSRGAALYFLLFVVVDVFQNKSKWKWLVLSLLAIFLFSIPFLGDVFENLGISSRTLNMYYDGELANDTGRVDIQRYYWNKLLESPIFGLGVWGDRTLDSVAYCHNVLIEICLNFGLLIGPIIILVLLVKLIKIYKKSSNDSRNQLLGYFCALILPLMTSGSYLISNEFTLFVGLCYLINKNNHYVSITTK